MVYCFCGFPLSGKSTLAKKLSEKIGVERVSTGDIARSLGMGLEPSIQTHDLSVVHNEEITKRAIEAVKQGKILDGFPRSLEQIHLLNETGVEFCVVFVTENPMVVFDRINARAAEGGRPEDKPEIVSGRLRQSMSLMHDIMSNIGRKCIVFPSRLGFDELLVVLGVEK